MNRALILFLLALLCCPAHGARIEWVTVGDAGNLADDVWPPNVTLITQRARVTHGAVDHLYRIGKYEITNAQYAEFLNAVAQEDRHELYHENMNPEYVRSDFYPIGGIVQQGSPGSFTYQLVPGREEWPVTNVSFWNAIRFANWIHNGQPHGPQGAETTEDGAYTITREGMDNNSIMRNPHAKVFLPSEDEWYKAAYYQGGGADAGYWEFATGSDEPPIAEDPPGTISAAYRETGEFGRHIRFEPHPVGAYVNSPSPVGTFDQAGNASEWNDSILISLNGKSLRGERGGHFASSVEFISASGYSPRSRQVYVVENPPKGADPFLVNPFVGFRLASVFVLPGDIDQNGLLDERDLNELTLRVRDHSPDTWYDLTGDGRVDEDDRQAWVHGVMNTFFGDANLDGTFDSADLVLVFQASEYEDTVPLNSTWSTGDWNGDGDFDGIDLVVALRDGGYEVGSREPIGVVPEPRGVFPIALGILFGLHLVARIRRTGF